MKNYLKQLLPHLIIWTTLYLFGAFIAFDFNFTNWGIFNNVTGSAIFVLLFIVISIVTMIFNKLFSL